MAPFFPIANYDALSLFCESFNYFRYKSFLLEHQLIPVEYLEDPYRKFSTIIVKEEYIRETLFFLWPGKKFFELIDLLYSEGKLPQLGESDPNIKITNNKQGTPKTEVISKELRPMPATNGRRLRVFLCHASQDKPVVRELYQRLFAEKWIDPWLDDESLLPGQDWKLETEKAIEAANAVIVCLSSKSVSSEGIVQKDLHFALESALEKPEGTIFIIPVRLDECELPRSLKSYATVDYFPKSQRDAASRILLKSLQVRAESQPAVDSKPKRSVSSNPPVPTMKSEPEIPMKPPTSISADQKLEEPMRPRADQEKSKLMQALSTVLSLPKYLGRFVLDLMGRDSAQESTALIMGWIVLVILIFLALGIVNVDTLIKLKEALFPTK